MAPLILRNQHMKHDNLYVQGVKSCREGSYSLTEVVMLKTDTTLHAAHNIDTAMRLCIRRRQDIRNESTQNVKK